MISQNVRGRDQLQHIFKLFASMAVAKAASGAQASERVFYPGLALHPGHEIAARQMKQFGGMMSGVEECR